MPWLSRFAPKTGVRGARVRRETVMTFGNTTLGAATSGKSVQWELPQFIELDEERRVQIVQLLAELLEQSPD